MHSVSGYGLTPGFGRMIVAIQLRAFGLSLGKVDRFQGRDLVVEVLQGQSWLV